MGFIFTGRARLAAGPLRAGARNGPAGVRFLYGARPPDGPGEPGAPRLAFDPGPGLRFGRRAAALGLAVLLALPSAFVLAPATAMAARRRGAPAKKPAKTRAVLIQTEGADLMSGGEPVPAEEPLLEGARLELAAGARAWFGLGGEGKLMLTGPAALAFEAGGSRVFLQLGRLLATVPEGKGRFSVRTRLISASSAGGDFYIESAEKTRAYVCACNGLLDLASPTVRGFKARLKSGPGHSPQRFSLRSRAMIQAEAQVERHSDADLAALKEL